MKSLLPSSVLPWFIIATLLVISDCCYLLLSTFTTFTQTSLCPEIIVKLWTWYGSSDHQYSHTGTDASQLSGWIISQSIFNLFELIVQAYVILKILISDKNKNDINVAIVTLLVSMATLWKTLLYMCIILTSPDPVAIVPGLSCLNYQPLSANVVEVEKTMSEEGCAVQLFKFHFNFYWIVLPAMVVVGVWKRIGERWDGGKRD